MKIILVSLVLLLTACQTVPVKVPFPPAEEVLMKEPKQLKPIKFEDRDQIALSELITTVAQNYSICHENAIKYKAWQAWYTYQKDLFEKTM